MLRKNGLKPSNRAERFHIAKPPGGFPGFCLLSFALSETQCHFVVKDSFKLLSDPPASVSQMLGL